MRLPRGDDVGQLKAQDVSVELDGPVEVGHRQVCFEEVLDRNH
jgi:hypothetical protein